MQVCLSIIFFSLTQIRNPTKTERISLSVQSLCQKTDRELQKELVSAERFGTLLSETVN